MEWSILIAIWIHSTPVPHRMTNLSVVPCGTRFYFLHRPTDKSVGYFLSPFRAVFVIVVSNPTGIAHGSIFGFILIENFIHRLSGQHSIPITHLKPRCEIRPFANFRSLHRGRRRNHRSHPPSFVDLHLFDATRARSNEQVVSGTSQNLGNL